MSLSSDKLQYEIYDKYISKIIDKVNKLHFSTISNLTKSHDKRVNVKKFYKYIENIIEPLQKFKIENKITGNTTNIKGKMKSENKFTVYAFL